MKLPFAPYPFWLIALASWCTGLNATPADEKFQLIAHEFTETYIRDNPENSTELGDHRFDDKLTDYSPSALKTQEKDFQTFLDGLSKIDVKSLSSTNAVDAEILKLHIESELFDLREIRSFANNPLIYDESLANGVYLITAREFAPAEIRLRNVIKRLAGIPTVI